MQTEKEKNKCPYCNGTGTQIESENLSQCCGAENLYYDDCDICPECKEHAEYGIECDECSGSGLAD